jgi:hypothetical protein
VELLVVYVTDRTARYHSWQLGPHPENVNVVRDDKVKGPPPSVDYLDDAYLGEIPPELGVDLGC